MSTTEVEQYARPSESDIEQFARDLSQSYGAAVRLVTTSFVPASYKGKPEEAAAAILTGAEVGLSPMASLRSIDIINGVPAMRAVTLRALVQNAGHDIWTEESNATQAIVKGRRKGSDHVETSLWTIARAQGLGLTGKDNWKKQPIAMLLARATSELVRLIAADVILGIAYSAEEIIDQGEPQEMSVVPEVAPKRTTRSMKRKEIAPPAPVEEPPLDTDEPDDQVDTQSGEIPDQAGDQVDLSKSSSKRTEIVPTTPFDGDPLQPTQEELDEWASLPPDEER